MIKEEAIYYLRSKGVEVELAETAYNLVGGRIVYLRLIADALNDGRNFDGIPLLPKNDYLLTKFTGIQQNLLRDARDNVQSAQLMPGARYHDKGSQIIKALLKRQRLTEVEYYKIFGFDAGYSLLEKNVFALHVDTGVVTFQSRLIERFCESQQDWWQTVEKA